ncbi:unnamed protein product [Prorocentrum cordatum]|uniref:WW domain-containing protein n=1 Tax=Prorocentrum cordatum TaxID=2364126 RepID=A0ABN9SCC2_9DINO|nr:unnamed protein product [Polarella glacialis]
MEAQENSWEERRNSRADAGTSYADVTNEEVLEEMAEGIQAMRKYARRASERKAAPVGTAPAGGQVRNALIDGLEPFVLRQSDYVRVGRCLASLRRAAKRGKATGERDDGSVRSLTNSQAMNCCKLADSKIEMRIRRLKLDQSRAAPCATSGTLEVRGLELSPSFRADFLKIDVSELRARELGESNYWRKTFDDNGNQRSAICEDRKGDEAPPTKQRRGGGGAKGSKEDCYSKPLFILAARLRGGAPPPATADPWQEVADPASGQSYWWNQQTNETTAVGAPRPVPDAWKEVADPASGQSYWWNQQTNETTAVGAPRPTAAAAAQAAGVPAAAGGAGGGMMSGLGGAMAQGMATGVGFSVAGRMMDGIMGPRQTEVIHRDEGGGGGDAGGAGGGDDGDGWF